MEYRILDKTILMSLKNNEYNDFFRDIVNLILTKINQEKINQEKSVDFFKHLLSAKNFFDSDALPKHLSVEKEIGLFGELIILSEYINKNIQMKRL